jgi:hypothetical protein
VLAPTARRAGDLDHSRSTSSSDGPVQCRRAAAHRWNVITAPSASVARPSPRSPAAARRCRLLLCSTDSQRAARPDGGRVLPVSST